MAGNGNTREIPTIGMLWQLAEPTPAGLQKALEYAREKYGPPRTAMLNPANKIDTSGLGVDVIPSKIISVGYVFVLGEDNYAHTH